MSDIADVEGPEMGPPKRSAAPRSKPAKQLPSERMAFDKQLAVMRAYAAASGPDKQPTSNAEVAKIAGIAPSSVSLINPFLGDCGLIIREGLKQRPAQQLFDYLAAWEWNPETAGTKLAPAFNSTWFAKALLPKLAFRPLTREEAISFLADEAKASKDYKSQLELLIDFLVTSGIVAWDGNTLIKGNGKREGAGPSATDPAFSPPPPAPPKAAEPDESEVEKFSIPLPGKPSATVIVPKGLDADDWEMLKAMMETYVKRWKKGIAKDD